MQEGKERELGALRAVGQLPDFALQQCLWTQRDGPMGAQGDGTFSTEGPGFLKPIHAPCDLETEDRRMPKDTECLESEDAGSEHSGLRLENLLFFQASWKPSPHPRLWWSPMRQKALPWQRWNVPPTE